MLPANPTTTSTIGMINGPMSIAPWYPGYSDSERYRLPAPAMITAYAGSEL
jgi:hypothetical protein